MISLRKLAFGGVVLVACKGSGSKLQVERNVLVADDTAKISEAHADFPTCTDLPPKVIGDKERGPYDDGCFTQIATAFGSKKGFSPSPPDHAAAATVALVVLRDGRGDRVAHPNTWLNVLRGEKGIGQDILRLAVARKMAEAAPSVGRAFVIEDEAAAAKALKAIASALPGACPTYWLLGSNPSAELAPELSADHSRCVFEDLGRPDGPGPKYGKGIYRALEGAVSLWRDAERSLRMGMPNADPAAQATLQTKLSTIEAASRAIALPKQGTATSRFAEEHMDAGVPPTR